MKAIQQRLADFCQVTDLNCHLFASLPPLFRVHSLLIIPMKTKWRITRLYTSYDNFFPFLLLFFIIHFSIYFFFSPQTCFSVDLLLPASKHIPSHRHWAPTFFAQTPHISELPWPVSISGAEQVEQVHLFLGLVCSSSFIPLRIYRG